MATPRAISPRFCYPPTIYGASRRGFMAAVMIGMSLFFGLAFLGITPLPGLVLFGLLMILDRRLTSRDPFWGDRFSEWVHNRGRRLRYLAG